MRRRARAWARRWGLAIAGGGNHLSAAQRLRAIGADALRRMEPQSRLKIAGGVRWIAESEFVEHAGRVDCETSCWVSAGIRPAESRQAAHDMRVAVSRETSTRASLAAAALAPASRQPAGGALHA